MGRPLKIIKENASADPSGTVDAGYPNNGTTNNGFSRSYPGILGGSIPTFNNSNQVEASVAIEQKQYGTIYSFSGITVVWGNSGADFTNTLTAGSLIYAGDGLTDPTAAAIGVVNTVNTPATVTIDSAAASTDRFTTKGGTAATALVVNGPVVFSANYAGLTAGVVYYVQAVNDSTHFQVSLTPGGSVIQLNDETADITASQGQTVTIDSGATATVSNSAWTSATPVSNGGYIVRQKGKRKFLVVAKTTIQDEFIAQGGSYMISSVSNTDWSALGAGTDASAGRIFTAIKDGIGLSTNGTVYPVGVCTLVNVADASLTRNQMNLNLNKATGPDVFASSVSDHFAVDFTDNGTTQNAGTKFIATLNGASDTPDPATNLISVAVDNYC